MFDYIKGPVAYIDKDYLVIDKDGLGLRLYMNKRSLAKLEAGKEALVYTQLVVREDDLYINGFISAEEREMYQLLSTVSGIGPKLALTILSGLESASLQGAILKEDLKTLTTIPGVGKKTAQRMVLELKDPLEKRGLLPALEDVGQESFSNEPVLEALISLGYQEREAKKMMVGLDTSLSLADQVKFALKNR